MGVKTYNITDEDMDIIADCLKFAHDNTLLSSAGPSIKAVIDRLKKRQKKIATSSAKGKGSDLQKWVCQQFADMLGIPFDNQDDQCLIHSREMGQAGVDVVIRGMAADRIPFATETKATESVSLNQFVTQAKANVSTKLRYWLLVIRNKYLNSLLKEPVAVMAFSTFRELWEKAYGTQDDGK